MTVRGGSRQPVTVCQFVTCGRSNVALRTYRNVCGVIILERGILLHFSCPFICPDAGRPDPSRTVTF